MVKGSCVVKHTPHGRNITSGIALLLLDDVFDKLDEQRVAQIIKLVNDENFGQLFISDTHADRTEKAIKSVHQSYQIFKL